MQMGLTCDLRWCNSASRVTLISLSIYLSLLSVIAKPPTRRSTLLLTKFVISLSLSGHYCFLLSPFSIPKRQLIRCPLIQLPLLAFNSSVFPYQQLFKMVQKHYVAGYENFVTFMKDFKSNGQVVNVLFTGAKLDNGVSWCSDCVEGMQSLWQTIWSQRLMLFHFSCPLY